MQNTFTIKPATVTLKPLPISGPSSAPVRKQIAHVVFALVSASLLLCLTGCVSPGQGNKLPPTWYASGAATATMLGLRNASPETIGRVAAAQVVVCEMVRSNTITPQAIQRAVLASGVKDDITAAAAANLVMMVYIPVFNQQTNEVAARPYAEAIFCDGWASGLGVVSQPRTRARPSRAETTWPLVPLPAK